MSASGPADAAPLLEVTGLTKVYGGGFLEREATVALDNFSMKIEESPPSITAVAGESGSGKTTLARLILGFVSPTRGRILYRGRDLTEMSPHEWRQFRREVQAVFQDPYEPFNSFYPVDHVFEVPIRKFGLARTREESRRVASDAMEVVGLRPDEVLGKYPHQLSGGQRQRIMVARAFVLKPKLIVADEPVSMVDASLRAVILEIMMRLKRDFGISFLYITHDLSTAFQVADGILIFYEGVVAEYGSACAVIREPAHPYTRLLVASVPLPDPDHRWEGAPSGNEAGDSNAAGAGAASAAGPGRRGCRFYGRCPRRMPICLQAQPPLFPAGEEHSASCYLYDPAQPTHAQAAAPPPGS